MIDSSNSSSPARPRRRRTMIAIGRTAIAFALGAAFAAMALARAPATVGSASSATLGERVPSTPGPHAVRLSPETARHLLCTSSECLKFWPPLTVPSRATRLRPEPACTAASAILQRSNGMLQVTLNGLPLYRFAGDHASGEVNGQDFKGFGGIWHVLGVAGAPSSAAPMARARAEQPDDEHADDKHATTRLRPPRRRPRPATRTERRTPPPADPHAGPLTGAWPQLLGQAPQQRHAPASSTRCSLRGEVLGDRPREPALALAAVRLERRAALLGQLDERAPPVGGVGAARDQALGLEVADRLRHRLRAHALGEREVADRPGAFAVQAPEHGALREREAVLGAQAAHQLAEHDAQLAREASGVDGVAHGPQTISRKDRETAQFPCII